VKRGGEGRSNFIVFCLFLLLSLLPFWPIFFGKVNLNGNLLVSFYTFFGQNLPYKNIIGLDQLRLYFPGYSLIFEQLRNFELPLWNPFIFAGNLNMASLQSAVFYPFNLLGLFLPITIFWHLMRISPLVLGSFFMFVYLKNLKLSGLAAFFGGLSFGLSPFILTWGEEQVITPHTIIWLPVILYCIDKLVEDDSIRLTIFKKLCFAASAFSVAFSVFAGFIQTTIYVVMFAVFYTLFRLSGKKRKIKFGLVILASFIVGLLISAVQILPTAELYFSSARSVVASQGILFNFLLPPEALLTYLAPDFFGNPATWNFFRNGVSTYYESMMFAGIPVLLFGLYEIWEGRKEKLSRFYFLIGFGALVLTLNSPIAKLFLLLPIPVLSTSIANRLLFVATFCFVVLAAMGLNRWFLAGDRKVFKYISVIGASYFFVALYLFGVKAFGFPYFISGALRETDTLRITMRNLVLPFGIFVLTSAVVFVASLVKYSNRKVVAAIIIILVLFLESLLFSWKYFSFTDKNNVFPQTPVIDYLQENQGYFRSWGIGEAYFENNFATQYKIFFPEGYDSLNIISYAEFTQAMQNGSMSNVSFRADAGLGRGDTLELLSNVNRRKLIDLAGVKYVVAKQEDFELMEENNFKKVFESGSLGVFENYEVVPRVFLASNYEGPPEVDSTGRTTKQIDKERRKLIPEKLLSGDFDFRNVLVLEEPSPISAQYGPGTAEITSYKPQEVIVKTDSAEPKLLFLSDNYYPGWKATVDGNEVKILRADYTFRAVPLVPGKHTVRFYFESRSFEIGAAVSLLGLVFLVGLLGFRRL